MEFIKPKVTVEETNDPNLARFVCEPLERGYGQTLGNSMRRVLLSSLSGAAVEAITIEGAQHEFTTLDGVVEDVCDIVLNVKGLVFSAIEDGAEAVARISAKGPKVITGKDIEVPTEFTLINPDHVVATLAEGGKLEMTLRLGTGRGYTLADGNRQEGDPIGIIHTDSLYSPVRRATMNVADTRVGQRTDYDKLTLEVETNGAMAPLEAVLQAADIVVQHMQSFLELDESRASEPEQNLFKAPDTNEAEHPIDELGLSVRATNCLRRASIESLEQLVGYTEAELRSFKNFGVKSIDEVKEHLAALGLSLKQV
ncbi:MAG: DNA-directed RNA polymerase subunit alpha [Coriobacteriales bacterium]|jgi:DNA-directed RNA polymerase subunit alpha|nr:DNA-directed RNA polymerase subunit alpha [Coriobacteriales bacterium]